MGFCYVVSQKNPAEAGFSIFQCYVLLVDTRPLREELTATNLGLGASQSWARHQYNAAVTGYR